LTFSQISSYVVQTWLGYFLSTTEQFTEKRLEELFREASESSDVKTSKKKKEKQRKNKEKTNVFQKKLIATLFIIFVRINFRIGT